MRPIHRQLNTVRPLINSFTYEGIEYSEINIKQLTLRPIVKRIVFITSEFGAIALYEGQTLYEAHKNDSDEVLISAFLAKIDTDFRV